jgi:hypothetical protein
MYSVVFDHVEGKTEYVINASRLWFWGLVGWDAQRRIAVRNPAARVTIERAREKYPVLY